ncbi:MAG: rod shape-determining protein MreC [Desulfovibrionaceae bacterium]|nr:rod shape-determining protein MreC [Desulfovibrionaceae bacterium]MBF0512999.1 rod shape-determining protein MreC [Desulfovibrionaceae bacterium]
MLVLFLYLGLYTWNMRTGYLDTLADVTGLEVSRWVLAPGKWAADSAELLFRRYIYFIGLRQENERLSAELKETRSELAGATERAALAGRLSELMSFSPPEGWVREGARVVSHRLGPNAALETIMIDKGSRSGLAVNLPVVLPFGVVGKTLRVSPNAAVVLLVNDLNSRIPVMGQIHRTQGILAGQGPDDPMEVQYVPQGAPLDEGELLITSGLGEVFPKGLPVARVLKVETTGPTLFQNVLAGPLSEIKTAEEVLVLKKPPLPPDAPAVEEEKEARPPLEGKGKRSRPPVFDNKAGQAKPKSGPGGD